MTRVKICGITNLEDGLHATAHGADALGFNFYEKSPRYITADDAALICARIGATAKKIGVFVNRTVDQVVEISNVVGLDAVQLHGNETKEYVSELSSRMNKGVEVIKAMHVGPGFSTNEALEFNCDAILLDTFSADEFGGTGTRFDWETARSLSTRLSQLYLAGGLSPDNVADAIHIVRPYAVDACSMLEESTGKKDHDKVARFIAAAKEAL